MVIGNVNDCTGSCKSNDHMITTTTFNFCSPNITIHIITGNYMRLKIYICVFYTLIVYMLNIVISPVFYGLFLVINYQAILFDALVRGYDMIMI